MAWLVIVLVVRGIRLDFVVSTQVAALFIGGLSRYEIGEAAAATTVLGIINLKLLLTRVGSGIIMINNNSRPSDS